MWVFLSFQTAQCIQQTDGFYSTEQQKTSAPALECCNGNVRPCFHGMRCSSTYRHQGGVGATCSCDKVHLADFDPPTFRCRGMSESLDRQFCSGTENIRGSAFHQGSHSHLQSLTLGPHLKTEVTFQELPPQSEGLRRCYDAPVPPSGATGSLLKLHGVWTAAR